MTPCEIQVERIKSHFVTNELTILGPHIIQYITSNHHKQEVESGFIPNPTQSVLIPETYGLGCGKYSSGSNREKMDIQFFTWDHSNPNLEWNGSLIGFILATLDYCINGMNPIKDPSYYDLDPCYEGKIENSTGRFEGLKRRFVTMESTLYCMQYSRSPMGVALV